MKPQERYEMFLCHRTLRIVDKLKRIEIYFYDMKEEELEVVEEFDECIFGYLRRCADIEIENGRIWGKTPF